MGALLAFVASLAVVSPLLGQAALTAKIGVVIAYVVALIACVAVHEFGHAYVADRLGDPLPRAQGRVTLNPLAHIDPLGTVIFPALMALGVAVPLAWGKPVEWSGHPRYLTKRFSMRTIRFFVAVAGPGMNLALAIAISLVFIVAAHLGMGYGSIFATVCVQLILLNLGLMFFNLLPIPPLDGRVFLEYLPDSLAVVRDFLTKYGSYVFLALILLGGVGGSSPLTIIMYPFNVLRSLFLGVVLRLAF